jgi:membrane-bound acyltransferase YfiQ involved in biofilm formation
MKHNPTLLEWRFALTIALGWTAFFCLGMYVTGSDRDFVDFLGCLLFACHGAIAAGLIFHGKPKR